MKKSIFLDRRFSQTVSLKKVDMKNDFLRNVNFDNSCTLGFDLLRNENQMITQSEFFKSYTQNHQNERFKTFNDCYQSSYQEQLTARDARLNEFMDVASVLSTCFCKCL